MNGVEPFLNDNPSAKCPPKEEIKTYNHEGHPATVRRGRQHTSVLAQTILVNSHVERHLVPQTDQVGAQALDCNTAVARRVEVNDAKVAAIGTVAVFATRCGVPDKREIETAKKKKS